MQSVVGSEVQAKCAVPST